MKAVFVKGRNAVSVDEVGDPKMASDGDVLVRMKACGLCGSDLEKVYGEYGMSSGRLGHEPSGEVIAVGSSVKGFTPGDRVFIHHHVACYSCHYCNHGDHTMCPSYQTSNISPCGLAEQFLVPEWNVSRGGLIKLPDGIGFEEASLVEPLACCIRALRKSNIQNGDDVAVFGAGPAGMMHVMLAQALGAGKTFAVDINDFRLGFARKHGVRTFNAQTDSAIHEEIRRETGGRGVDICVVATGSMRALQQSLNARPDLHKPTLPKDRGDLRIDTVLATTDPESHLAAVERWARSAWDAYSELHGLARQWIEQTRRERA